jgi:CRISPR-associated endoribonuclease Cas6
VGEQKDMGGLLSHFKFGQFEFVLRAEDSIHLPSYKGSTLRGGFGHAFKKVVCVNRQRVCETCLLKDKCVYSYVFETPPPPDTSKMRKYPYAPHPFVITPPLEEKRNYQEGETLCFELTLVGKSIDFLPYFIYTFDELGKMGIGKGKGRYQLEEVKGKRSRVKGENVETIYSGQNKTLHNSYKVMKMDDLNSFDLSPKTLHLSFLTPTRLKFDGSLSPRPEFHILFRNLLRRISLLSYFHCGEELNLDFRGLIEKSRDVRVKGDNLSWFDWERYSNRQDTKMMMGGFVGSITFEGDLEEFMPFILLGQYIHVGKGTSFGLGKYEIVRT